MLPTSRTMSEWQLLWRAHGVLLCSGKSPVTANGPLTLGLAS
jgi:hypothetical protein